MDMGHTPSMASNGKYVQDYASMQVDGENDEKRLDFWVSQR